MKFSWASIKRPIVALAPMEGYTDSAFRQLIKTYAPHIVCFTEFTSADALTYKSKVSRKKIAIDPREQPIVVQLFGKKPDHFVEAIKYVEEAGAAAIDINMGCPAKKVIASKHGSALLKNPDLAAEIVHNVVKNTSLDVSVKTRLGFSSIDEDHFFSFGEKLAAAGASLITVHGRTTKQGYGGTAQWDPIYALKKRLSIPVIGNGDIKSALDAQEKLGNLDGVMVGRATMGNPLIMKEIYDSFFPNQKIEEKLPDWFEIAKKHIALSVETKGERRGMLEMRKHLALYFKGFPNASTYRSKLVRVETQQEALDLIKEIKENSLS
ncbi:dihydrouridine synthase [Candidatus Peregrinibacteria bacterium]|nr:dihydrouridine synthase [Candidatus Peregrinibacteria bacterium]